MQPLNERRIVQEKLLTRLNASFLIENKEALVTVTLTEDVGLTTVTTLIAFGSKQARDAAVATGMTDGMEQSHQLLDRVLSEQPRA